jgi:RNA polymerase sigma factor (sigma-70 family)
LVTVLWDNLFCSFEQMHFRGNARLDAALRELATHPADNQAWRIVYEDVSPFVVAVARRILKGHPELTEDITQEVFRRLAIYQTTAKFADNSEGFLRYVYVVASNVSRTYLRKVAASTQELSDTSFSSPDFRTVEAAVSIASLSRGLDETDRRLLNMVRSGLRIREVAEKLEITPGTASVRLHRLIAKLKAQISSQTRQSTASR